MGYSVETTGVAGAALGIIAIVLVMYLLTFGLSIIMYILQALGIYTIAQRRGLKHPWMAWLPVTNMWILGSISDQYRYVALGQVRNRRKVLLGIQIALMTIVLVLLGAYVAAIVKLALQIPDVMYVVPQQVVESVLAPMLWVLGVLAALWVLAIVGAVLQYVCLYDLYASCIPENKVLFLVLSILINVTMPFFVFACRKKDDGMPPRKDEVPAALPAQPAGFTDPVEE